MSYRNEIEFAARLAGLDPDLVEAVVLVESSGRTDAFRHEPDFYERYVKGKPEYEGRNPRRIASSYGLMQIMYTTAQLYGFRAEPEMLFLPNIGLEYGCRHLAALLKKHQETGDALEAYNAGRANTPAGEKYRAKVISEFVRVRAQRLANG